MKIEKALLTYDPDEVEQCVRDLLNQDAEIQDVIEGLSYNLEEIGNKFEKGDIFIPHLIAAGEAAKKALKEVLEPEILKKGRKRETSGRVVIGTVAGDIHDIGKNIVSSFLFAAGFEIHDLGTDVSADSFIEKVRETNADILGMSALLGTSLPFQKTVIEELKKEGLRDGVKVIIGGAPATRSWAEKIGADGYAADAIGAVALVKKLMGASPKGI